jgi:hypothetical protein
MLELMPHGLAGLAAVVVIAFCLAYSDESSLLEQRSINRMDKAQSLFSQWPGERSARAIYGGAPRESVRGEAFNG